jgi:CheY-like chemotaxis protein
MIDKQPVVLIVDDETHVRMIIRAYLAPYDIDVFDTRDGVKAIEIMREKDIDLVILDYTMPILSGQEVLDLMMQDQALENIAVILYTAGGFEKDIETWLKTSSNYFIKKSNLGDELMPILEKHFGDRLRMKNENSDR